MGEGGVRVGGGLCPLRSQLPCLLARRTFDPDQEVMRPTEFRVRMRDIGDNAVLSVVDPTSPTNAPLPLRLQLTPGGLPQQSAVVVDAGSGEFIVRYLVPISGRYQLRVLLGHERQNIQGSPFTIIVDHATAGGAGQAEGAQTERHSRRRSGDGDTGCAE